jgi:pSer/pThr/pTyr-binding forkhead associated (FHA) protein
VTLTFLNGSLKGKEWQFSRPARCVIGRSGECDLQLPSTREFGEVSRRHCELDIDLPAVRVRDLDSRNGTLVNGNSIGQRQKGGSSGGRCGGWHALKDSDELRVGDTFFRVGISGGVGHEAAARPAGQGSGL